MKTLKRRSRRASFVRKLAVSCVALVALACSLAASGARAQDAVGPFPSEWGAPGLYVIRNARIVTVSGPEIENGTIVLRDGRIEAVGASVTAPSGAREIDGRGLWVFPGMMDASTNLGLAEIAAGVTGSVDSVEVGDINPNAQAFYGINPHSSHVDVTRVNGITSVVSAPAGGVVSGQAAIINLAGTTPREMALVPQAALVINFPLIAGGGGFGPPPPITPDAISARERRVDEIRRLLRDAEAYGRAQDAHARDPRGVPRPATDLQLAALVPYARGERPVMLRADRERDIRAAVRFAEEMKLRAVVVGGSDAAKVAALLKEKNIPVVFERMWTLPLRE
ncbi:MAG TPA: hypothetical protein VFX96_06750, partial [Pyrinomonadaceae bacterium]|nr:hypothetical protein [Pyrinomonadaceae bacterium]